MIDWIYFGVAGLSWRFIAGWLVRHDDDLMLSVILGGLLAMVWPLTLAAWLGHGLWVRWPDAVVAVFIHQPSHARRERRRERLQAEIDRLERELDL